MNSAVQVRPNGKYVDAIAASSKLLTIEQEAEAGRKIEESFQEMCRIIATIPHVQEKHPGFVQESVKTDIPYNKDTGRVVNEYTAMLMAARREMDMSGRSDAIYKRMVQKHAKLEEIAESIGMAVDSFIDLVRQYDIAYTQHRKDVNDFANANMGLPPYVAQKFADRGVPMHELQAEANDILLRAASRFNYRFGNKFSTFAVACIENGLRKMIRNTLFPENIRNGAREQLKKLVETENTLPHILGRKPTAEELCDAAGISYTDYTVIHDRRRKGSSFEVAQETHGLDSANDARAILHESRDFIDTLFSVLDENEQRIISVMYGFDTSIPNTAKAIGECLGIPPHHVKPLRERAVRKMRNASLSLLQSSNNPDSDINSEED